MTETIITDSEIEWWTSITLRDTRYERCAIRGPVFLDVRGGNVSDSVFDYEPGIRDLPWAAVTYSDTQPPDSYPHIRLRNCEFTNCRFTNVWVWAPRSIFPKTRLAQWWWMRRNFTFVNVRRKIYRGPRPKDPDA